MLVLAVTKLLRYHIILLKYNICPMVCSDMVYYSGTDLPNVGPLG